MSSLITELKRRNVFRVGAAYGVAGWLLTEISSVVLPLFGASENALRIMVVMLAIGFPVALVFAWIYEITPEGVKREDQIDRDNSITQTTGRKLDLTTIGMVIAGVLFVLFERLIWVAPEEPIAEETGTVQTATVADPGQPPAVVETEPEPGPNIEDGRISVAVLPFVNMSSDPEQDYFSDGISEELLNVLVKLDKLRVPSRTSSFAFKGQTLSIAEIARQLNVAHVLEGSVRKSGNQVRVTAQLIDVDTDAHLWSETYTRTLDDIFVIQDEIANAIVDALKITLNAGESLEFAETGDSLAYNHYLKGRFFWHQRTAEAFASAEREFRAAVEMDPDFGMAWAGLADVYVLMPEYSAASIDEAIPKARAALERALILNAESAQAITTQAYLRYSYDWDYAQAERDYLEAIAIDPNYATAYQWYAEFLSQQRRRDEALEYALRAAELDPLAPVKPLVIGNILTSMGRAEEADLYYEQALELAPEWPFALRNMTRSYLEQDRFDDALILIDRLEVAVGKGKRIDSFRLAILALAGRIPVEQAVESLLETSDTNCYVPAVPTWLARLSAFDEAITWIENCMDKGDPYAVYINAMRAFEPMRGMPRFQALLARINLPVEDAEQ